MNAPNPINSNNAKEGYGSALISLFASSSTLICCALPALLVALGAGAVLSSLISAVPQLVIFSEHKPEIFGFAFLMLAGNGVWQWRNRNAPCPVGLSPEQAMQCGRTRKMSQRIYWFSVALFAVGGWFAFVQPWLSA
jgi:hypothetical protein